LLAADALTASEFEFDEAKQKVTERGTTCTALVAIDKDNKTSGNKLALQQLGKAGFRLAALLVWILEGK
jgi:malonyl CoA-acyl carrier protein transacylase